MKGIFKVSISYMGMELIFGGHRHDERTRINLLYGYGTVQPERGFLVTNLYQSPIWVWNLQHGGPSVGQQSNCINLLYGYGTQRNYSIFGKLKVSISYMGMEQQHLVAL